MNEWEPGVADLSVSDWILPWSHALDTELENVMVTIYHKLLDFFKQSTWTLSDSSFISLLLSWKEVLNPFLYKKLLEEVIEPVFVEFLEEFEIFPPNQDITSFPIIINVFKLYANEDLEQLFAYLLEKYFFERWLDILYTWIDDEGCLLDEVLKWYQGWKELFSFDWTFTNNFVITSFQRALRIINSKVQINIR